MDILLSFPRSGNHLIRFIIEYIIGYPTKGCIDKDIPVYLNLYKTDKLMSHVIPEPFIIEKLHDSNSISNASSLIFIVRDFKECIPNHNNYNGDYRESMKLYIQNFIYYSNYKGPKLLIYYEDMIENSMTTIFSIINFIIQYNITLKNLLIHDNITTITNRLHYFIQNNQEIDSKSFKYDNSLDNGLPKKLPKAISNQLYKEEQIIEDWNDNTEEII